jgi:MerR family redox-sensitive transcriptional activator SoxR
MAELSVGQVAKRSGVSISALHFYERKGLISSHRNEGNQRRYHQEVLRRVSIIKAAQKMGVSLVQICEAFAFLPKHRAPSKKEWKSLAASWQGQLDGRIAYLQRLRNSLTGCIGCGCLSMESCPIYNPDDQLAKIADGPVILDGKKPADDKTLK